MEDKSEKRYLIALAKALDKAVKKQKPFKQIYTNRVEFNYCAN